MQTPALAHNHVHSPLVIMTRSTPPPTSPNVMDLLLQFCEHAMQLAMHGRMVLQQLNNSNQFKRAIDFFQKTYGALPESVGVAVAIVVLFVSTIVMLRVGRTVISLLVLLVQMVLLLLVLFVVWKLREPLAQWLEGVLAQ